MVIKGLDSVYIESIESIERERPEAKHVRNAHTHANTIERGKKHTKRWTRKPRRQRERGRAGLDWIGFLERRKRMPGRTWHRNEFSR